MNTDVALYNLQPIVKQHLHKSHTSSRHSKRTFGFPPCELAGRSGRAFVFTMATSIPSASLSSEMRRMMDDNFHQALEKISNIYGPLLTMDKAKANRLAKLSHDLAQIHKEAHSDGIISFQSLTEPDFGIGGQSSSEMASEFLKSLEINGEPPLPARHRDGNAENNVNRQVHEKEDENDNKPTWAKVVASAPEPAPEPAQENRDITLSRSAVAGNKGTEEPYIGVLNHPIWKEGEEWERRVVEVHKLPRTTSLRQVTCKVEEGPLMHVGLQDWPDNTKSACLIFMDAGDAKRFFLRNEAIRLEMGEGQSSYGPDTPVLWGNPYPDTGDVARMCERGGVRRRLTFSGKGLFARIPPARFYLDVADAGGKANIELVWLFNKGNATVVFNDIRMAMNVLNTFQEKAKCQGPYEGVKVSFSSDLCESHIALVTQLPWGGEVKISGCR